MSGDLEVPVRLVDLSLGCGDDDLHLLRRYILGSTDGNPVLLGWSILIPELVFPYLAQRLDDDRFLHPASLNDNPHMIDLASKRRQTVASLKQLAHGIVALLTEVASTDPNQLAEQARTPCQEHIPRLQHHIHRVYLLAHGLARVLVGTETPSNAKR